METAASTDMDPNEVRRRKILARAGLSPEPVPPPPPTNSFDQLKAMQRLDGKEVRPT